MVTFAALDQRLSKDSDSLHDFLWQGKKAGESKLRADIQKDLRDLDAYLSAAGKLRKAAAVLDRTWGEPGAGESLFELINHTYNLTAATDHLGRRRDPKGAGEHVADAVESVSIGVCSNA